MQKVEAGSLTILTDAKIRAIRAPQKGQVEVRDKSVPGLRVRVGSSGARSFVLRKSIAGRYRNIMLGRYSARFGLAEARKKARQLITDIELGADPAAILPSAPRPRAIPTVRSLWPDYRVAKAHLRSIREIERVFSRERIKDMASDYTPERGRAPEPAPAQRDPFADLKLRAAPRQPSLADARDIADRELALDKAVLRFARVTSQIVAERKQGRQEAPHQAQDFLEAGRALDELRTDGARDLRSAFVRDLQLIEETAAGHTRAAIPRWIGSGATAPTRSCAPIILSNSGGTSATGTRPSSGAGMSAPRARSRSR